MTRLVLIATLLTAACGNDASPSETRIRTLELQLAGAEMSSVSLRLELLGHELSNLTRQREILMLTMRGQDDEGLVSARILLRKINDAIDATKAEVPGVEAKAESARAKANALKARGPGSGPAE